MGQPAPSIEPTDFDELMAQAERQRSVGEHASAARSYAAAYRVLPYTEQVGLMGELAVENALTEYRTAYEQQVGAWDLLEESLGLLEVFIDARSRAHADGKVGEVPAWLEGERARLRELLEARMENVSRRGHVPNTTAVPAPKAEAKARYAG